MPSSVKCSCSFIRKRIAAMLLWSMMVPAILDAQSMPVPPGWTMQQKSDTFFLRPNNTGNHLYSYVIFPVSDMHGDAIKTWAGKMIGSDLPLIGSSNDPFQIIPVTANMYSSSYTAKDLTGKPIELSYLIHQGVDGKARIARIVADPDKSFYLSYLNVSVRHFMELVKSTNGKIAVSSPSSGTNTGKKKVSIDEIKAAPGKGLKAAEMEGIYINLETGVGVGGFPTQEYNPYLLLKDKSIYKRLLNDPFQLDVQRSKELEPEQWGTWRSAGNDIIVNWKDGKQYTWKVWHKTLPAENGTRLNGYYRSIGGGGSIAAGGDVITFSSDGITFFEDGRYVRGKSSGASAAGSGPYGTWSGSAKSSGTYQVAGNKIILKDDNGKQNELAFYFFPDKNKQRSNDVIGIGGNVYSR